VPSEQSFRAHNGFEVAQVAPARGFKVVSEQPFRAHSGFEMASEHPFQAHSGFQVAQVAPVREIAVLLRRQVAAKPRNLPRPEIPQPLCEIIE